MKVKVTKEGLLIPPELLEGLGADEGLLGLEEVEVRREPGRLIVLPADRVATSPGEVVAEEDPILGLGSNPVSDDSLVDASTDHDYYLYGAPRR